MHVFGEKFSKSNSMWKPYPDPHNFEEISKQRSILFHFRTLTSGSIFSSQNNRSRELSHTLDHNRPPRTCFRHSSGNISVGTGFLSSMVPMNKRFEA